MATARALSPEAVNASGHVATLAPEARRLHRSLVEAVLATGSVPSVRELAGRFGAEESMRAGLATLAAADYLALDGRGQVSCLYPFSTAPTAHGIVIDGRQRYAMCSIDALGIPAMIGEELEITGRCAICDRAIAIRVAPGAILTATPPETRVVARRDEAEPAFAACCPFTVFVCGQEHADRFARRLAGTHALSLGEALIHAEDIFGGLLAEDLPASRPRGRRWGQARNA